MHYSISVPIVPDFLKKIDDSTIDHPRVTIIQSNNNVTQRTHAGRPVTYANWTQNDVVITSGPRDPLYSSDIGKENSKVGWLLSSKAIVQLIINPVIGPITNRYALFS